MQTNMLILHQINIYHPFSSNQTQIHFSQPQFCDLIKVAGIFIRLNYSCALLSCHLLRLWQVHYIQGFVKKR